jgi:hypothetical protein
MIFSRSISKLNGLWPAMALSRSEPMSLVNIELHGAVVTHLQQERLAVVLILYVHALHDFESLQRLFAKGN